MPRQLFHQDRHLPSALGSILDSKKGQLSDACQAARTVLEDHWEAPYLWKHVQRMLWAKDNWGGRLWGARCGNVNPCDIAVGRQTGHVRHCEESGDLADLAGC